jgi:hypothetical protein
VKAGRQGRQSRAGRKGRRCRAGRQQGRSRRQAVKEGKKASCMAEPADRQRIAETMQAGRTDKSSGHGRKADEA